MNDFQTAAFNQITQIYKLNMKAQEAFKYLVNNNRTPIYIRFQNGHLWFVGRNTLYACMKEKGFTWDSKNEFWVRL